MANKNDSRNEALVKQIEAKEKALIKPVVQFRTNCSLELFGCKKNLNVCRIDELILIKVQLNTMVLSAKDMGITADEVKIGGYSMTDWISDVDAKIEMAKYNEAKTKLTQMKTNLNKLLSEDRRTEIALDAVEETLNNM